MESSSGTYKEPEVGILLDLGSPFNTTGQANDTCDDTSEATKEASGDSAGVLASKPSADPGDKSSEDKQSAKSSTDRSSRDTRSSDESPRWADLPDEYLIDSEQFDFDLPVSPVESARVEVDDEDEVFFGPVGFTEACVAKKTQLKRQSPDCKPMSPLNVEQYVELFLEANKVAMELTNQRKSDDSQGSEHQDCKDKETGTANGISKKSEHSEETISEESNCHSESSDGLVSLLGKLEVRNFKRLVRKEMRSPRRGTYTISVSPANTPPPPHLPSADECVSKLTQDKPQMIQFSAAGKRDQPSLKAPHRESKLPVKGTRRSKLPMKGGLNKMVPPPNPSSGTSTDKLLRKKLSSPPKRKRLNSCESEDLISEASSSVASETSETLSLGIPKGKRPQPGSFYAKGTSGLRPPANQNTPSASTGPVKQKPTTAAATNGMKAPVAKPSLLQQGSQQRRTVQASRLLKLVKPGQHGSLQLTSKPQPLKAMAGIAKVPSSKEDTSKVTPKKAVSLKQTPSAKPCKPSRKPSTPTTPVHLAKKVVPKRLLTNDQSASKPTPRSLSTSSVPTPRSKLIPPSTPSRSDSKSIPASVGSTRRRSAIPTPSRHSVVSASRLNTTSSSIANPSPMRFRANRTFTTTSSPSASSRPSKPAPAAASEGAIKLDLDSSPACTKETTTNSGRSALETKTNVLEAEKNSPVVGLLIDIKSDLSDEKLSKAVVTQGRTRNKENLIDLL